MNNNGDVLKNLFTVYFKKKKNTYLSFLGNYSKAVLDELFK